MNWMPTDFRIIEPSSIRIQESEAIAVEWLPRDSRQPISTTITTKFRKRAPKSEPRQRWSLPKKSGDEEVQESTTKGGREKIKKIKLN